ncbi:MAG: cytochrome B5 [Candidatus Schekmanbacteria bacterium GWA2_38_11]|uniref:Cytochrome B5 n=1 Tax=Candidatus Schekmanbacteria bacterium GWA2_38_11 TaxID=1817876 RepID=A0A1F7RF16_9BACT|nr:MAG: cytochrome B5 [Candidatus Schekmanbacteria bacterium GWA2_38_11]
MNEKVFDEAELKKFDGKEGRKAYVAVNGKVYDITESDLWQDGEHGGIHVAGQDLTDEIDNGPHGEDIMENWPVVGTFKS